MRNPRGETTESRQRVSWRCVPETLSLLLKEQSPVWLERAVRGRGYLRHNSIRLLAFLRVAAPLFSYSDMVDDRKKKKKKMARKEDSCNKMKLTAGCLSRVLRLRHAARPLCLGRGFGSAVKMPMTAVNMPLSVFFGEEANNGKSGMF